VGDFIAGEFVAMQCNGRGRGRVRLQVGKATKFIFGRGWIEGGIRGVLP
jgi:hypothetical protein